MFPFRYIYFYFNDWLTRKLKESLHKKSPPILNGLIRINKRQKNIKEELYVQNSEWAFVQEICYIYLRLKEVSTANLLLFLMDYFTLKSEETKTLKVLRLVSQLNFISYFVSSLPPEHHYDLQLHIYLCLFSIYLPYSKIHTVKAEIICILFTYKFLFMITNTWVDSVWHMGDIQWQ